MISMMVMVLFQMLISGKFESFWKIFETFRGQLKNAFDIDVQTLDLKFHLSQWVCCQLGSKKRFQSMELVSAVTDSKTFVNKHNEFQFSMHDEYYDDTDADYHTTDYIPKMRKVFWITNSLRANSPRVPGESSPWNPFWKLSSFDHHEKWHAPEHVWIIYYSGGLSN